MEYLKLFSSHTDYEDYASGGTMINPNVSYCKNIKDVHYNPCVDYSKEYFTIEALGSGTIKFTIGSAVTTSNLTSMSYSTDSGETWTTTGNVDNQKVEISVSVSEGDKVLWKGEGNRLATATASTKSSVFSSTCDINVMGSIMSLIYGDGFKNQVSLSGKNYCFCGLFSGATKVISAENLSLPATTLAEFCYQNMFDGCTSLTTTSKLPATTLSRYCYYYMFNGCINLTTTPVLSATTLASYCYGGMFANCTNLTSTPKLPVTTLETYCYYNMFQGCTSLTSTPKLPATTLTNSCYYGMFNGCTNLTTAPVLPATTLANNCYSYMFSGCTSLTTASELPATTLANYCYYGMFYGCTSLTTAPELYATTLERYCYNSMFNGCTTLNYIKMMATDISASSCLNNWVNGVAASGTFVKNSAAEWDVSGVNGIPTGWTVQTASA